MFRFRFGYFLAAFLVGLVFAYILSPENEVVIKFPSPVNAGSIVYDKGDGECFKYVAEKNECPIDRDLVKPQP